MLKYFLFHKPFQVMSQFSPIPGKKTLADYLKVPKDVYPVGRLDYDSEGLLLLTNDPSVNHAWLHPTRAHEREYWVQVDGAISSEALKQLSAGVSISIDGKTHLTKPTTALAMESEPDLPARNPPIRFRANIPTSWIRIMLMEGKNRQVRRMTAAVGFPTLRLVRWRMGQHTLAGLQPGEFREIAKKDLF